MSMEENGLPKLDDVIFGEIQVSSLRNELYWLLCAVVSLNWRKTGRVD